jgi:hypothetical protein
LGPRSDRQDEFGVDRAVTTFDGPEKTDLGQGSNELGLQHGPQGGAGVFE